jgi:protein-tyrosine-phosphatase
MSYSVLFVCTANICRSPMAEALFRAMVSEQAGEWRIASAGTWAAIGQPAARFTRQVLAEQRISMDDHCSQAIERELMEQYALVLVMERGHKEALQVEFPDLAGRVYMLSEMVSRHREVYDPIGGPMIDFQDMAKEIESHLQDGYELIRAKAQDPEG